LPAELFPSPQATSSLKYVLNDPRVDLFLPEKIFPGPALRVMNVSQNLRAENNSSKKVKMDDFFYFEATAVFFLAELTFFTYSHKLQNLSFNLAVIYFCAP
jgi:hypothetical protein